MNEEKNNQELEREKPQAQKIPSKEKLDDICRKIMKIVMPCICVTMVILLIFKGSADARNVKKTLKSEGCNVKILTSADEISDAFKELDFQFKNVDELVIAVDKEDSEIYAIVLFCESRLDAEDVEDELMRLLYTESDTESYSVERNAKAVCFGYVDLVEAVMETLD